MPSGGVAFLMEFCLGSETMKDDELIDYEKKWRYKQNAGPSTTAAKSAASAQDDSFYGV
jgi:5-methylcytosine-specific restriction endonuclease McrBC GTP-binding regulatory subunit McrB